MKTQRIGWIDALRGFTMILVVFSHMEVLGMGMPLGYTGVNDLFRLFRMPLFFFVSGFIAYRIGEVWDWGHYSNSMLKKLRVQVIPMLFFGLLYSTLVYAHRFDTTPTEAVGIFFNSSSKLGYWFTEALLGMFVIYYTTSFLLRRCKLATRQWVLVAIAIGLYALSFRSVTHFENNTVARWIGFYNLAQYFQFFIVGNLVSCYRERVFKVMGNSFVLGALLLLFTGLYIYYCSRSDVQSNYVFTPVSKLTKETISFLGIVTLVAVFKHYEQFFSKETWIGRGLQYIGQRTLDVYLIHYFLIPSLPMLGTFFSNTNNLILETTTAIMISLLVIFFCMIISNIIRISPFLAHWLLGVKQKK